MMRAGHARRARSARAGTAIVAALYLVVLAAALLASAAEIAASAARRSRADVAALLAEAGARRALADALQGWSSGYATLAIGQWPDGAAAASCSPPGGIPCTAAVRVGRLDSTLYALDAEATAGVVPHVARRRLRLLVSTRPVDAGGAIATARPISRWSLADLY